MTFLNAVGSSVGPLYATGFMRGGKAVAQKEELTDKDLAVYWIAFMNGVKELGIFDLFLKDWDESMSVDGVKTLPDVEFQKPARGSPLFFDPS